MRQICKLLLVEDSADDMFFLRRALQRHPTIQVVGHASDGGQAMAYMGGTGEYADRAAYPMPDVVVLDLKMPGYDGFAVLEWMQTMPERPKVAIFSTSDRIEDKARAEQLGADLYQPKTFELEVFDRFIHFVGMMCEAKWKGEA